MSFDILESKRKVLIASAQTRFMENFAVAIKSHIRGVQPFFAIDGAEAYSKICNDPPHIAFLEIDLAKKSGLQLAEDIVKDKKMHDVAVVLLSEIPEQEFLVDAVVRGQIQFLPDITDEKAFSKCLAKAMNYSTRDLPSDFNLHFLAPGDILLKQGERADYVYVVRKGHLKAYVHGEDGKASTPVEVGAISEGEFVGEMAYINNTARSADVIASTDCELIQIPIDHLDLVLFQKPSWAKALMLTLSRRVRKANERLS